MSRSLLLAATGVAIATLMNFFSVRPALADTCEAETLALRAVGEGVEVRVDAPKGGTTAERLRVSWQAKQKAPRKTPVYIAIAIPGEVRFQVAAVPAKRSDSEEDFEPNLPGFLALGPETRGPLGLEFGRGKSRALVPLHQPGAKLSGTFDVTNLPAGPLVIEASVVARTACGERVVSRSSAAA